MLLSEQLGPQTNNKLIKYARGIVRSYLDVIERTIRHMRWNIRTYKAKRSWLSPTEIAEYRKTIKIYDVFNFFNELDVLELRLNILDPYVDYFVIVEATETFSGQPKPLNFELNKERYKKWQHKIIYYVVDDVPADEDDFRARLNNPNESALNKEILQNALSSSSIGKDANGKAIEVWIKEFYIKESIKKALIGLNDDDICYISDLDEIWNPELIIDYSQDSVFKLIQKGYMYYLNNRSNEEDWKGWTGTIVTKYKNIKDVCAIHLRNHRMMEKRFIFLKNGGWHFAFQGGLAGAQRKIVESKHFWYDPEKTLPALADRVKNNVHYRGGKYKLWKDERGLPEYLVKNKVHYEKFFL
ncbi:MAG TPA: hypothetical protein VL335_00630 [Candidatus Paceibacterota bacterium]|jgi:beta-1,4-mannosyl-glycoprotein beta-1,4-N-acetylglucosaminyltransferase|nr:hypothetical protein [Candidatus Paceibacterota bacterium]